MSFRPTLFGMLLWLLCGTCCIAAPGPCVRIVLRESAEVRDKIVHLQDIATIEPANQATSKVPNSLEVAELIATLADLDITEFRTPRQPISLQRQQIIIRAKLAGIDLRDIEWRGAHHTRITFGSPITEQSVIDRVRDALAEYLGISAAEIEFQTNGKIAIPADLPWDESLELRPHMPTPMNLEKPRMTISVCQGAQTLRSISIAGTAKLVRHALVATKRIEAGAAIQKRNSEIREVTLPLNAEAIGLMHEHEAPLDYLGTYAIKPIDIGQVIHRGNTNVTADSKLLTIAARDRVRLVAQRNGLTVTLSDAEALEKGSVGDTIRVRNPQSGRIVAGRISPSGDILINF